MNVDADRLANEILDLARNKLLVNLRFLDLALSWHGRVPYAGTFGTDGRDLYYNVRAVLLTYRDSEEESVRTYLHTILHCLFLHPFVGAGIEKSLWDLACDIAVERSISELGLTCTGSVREAEQLRWFAKIGAALPNPTAERIYALFRREPPSEEEIASLRRAFRYDDHTLWYRQAEQPAPDGEGGFGADAPGSFPAARAAEPGGDAAREEAERFWKKTAEQVQMDLETFSRQQGHEAGSMVQELRAVNRERYDYTRFLRKFASLGEILKVNEDEFDYIYYLYGLNRFGNMPLVEPLEYREVRRIREFVIAIDTSGSVMGRTVQTFLQKTYNILMQEETYFSRVCIHILQCDAEIQEDAVITNRREFEEYLKNMKIRGLGGTDFRPVFRYVEKLREEHRFRNLKGLLYFTDGFGTYPEKKPPYRTAFIFLNDGEETPRVPVWAMKVVLERDELEDLQPDPAR